mgnify:CR=1 FL=1
MQPYIFPYLSYFQLVNKVDTFVFCDDVNFIKGGWIHRNRILLNDEAYFISFPLHKASQNKWIKDLNIKTESKEFLKILPTIRQAYFRAPNFNVIYPIIEGLITKGSSNLSVFASETVMAFADYLNMETQFLFSSKSFLHTKGQEKSERLINIAKELGANTYLNPIGGQEIYNKTYFENNGVHLGFLKTGNYSYQQMNNDFIADLSMIDVLMFNNKEAAKKMLLNCEII